MNALNNTVGFILQACAIQEREEKLAWVLHRVTGIGVFIFLALHIVHIWLIGFGPEPFNTLTAFLNHPLARILHIFLFFSVLFHAVNGIRVIILDFWPTLWQYRRQSVNIATGVFLLIFIPSTLLILMDAFLP